MGRAAKRFTASMLVCPPECLKETATGGPWPWAPPPQFSGWCWRSAGSTSRPPGAPHGSMPFRRSSSRCPLSSPSRCGSAPARRSCWASPLATRARRSSSILALAFFFRLPIAWRGAAATVTPDGALSGIVALHLRDGVERLVFVPLVPYSGSLKSHLAAALAVAIDPSRAFVLASVLFYVAYVAGLFLLARLVGGRGAAILAGVYAAFAPAFVTRYSLSNDGNYVEVLALGTWALWLAALWAVEDRGRRDARSAGPAFCSAWPSGVTSWPSSTWRRSAPSSFLGRPRAVRSLAWLGVGCALGIRAGLLWNARQRVGLVPVPDPGGGQRRRRWLGAGLAESVARMVTDHWPVLVGYDAGYGPPMDAVHRARSLGRGDALRVGHRPSGGARGSARARGRCAVLLIFTVVNLGVALRRLPLRGRQPALPPVPDGPAPRLPGGRAPASGRGAGWCSRGSWRWARWRSLGHRRRSAPCRRAVARASWGLEREGVRFCYTDFHLATRINFISGRGGHLLREARARTTTEYFLRYPGAGGGGAGGRAASRSTRLPRTRSSAASKRLGVTYERRDLMKPVLLRLSRKVDPEELFPGRSFDAAVTVSSSLSPSASPSSRTPRARAGPAVRASSLTASRRVSPPRSAARRAPRSPRRPSAASAPARPPPPARSRP